MDCREFRKLHFAYLDDTLPGDNMSAAQRHVMACDSCAAHDTMVRRSLMLVRNMQTIEPSEQFRQRMQSRLAETRAETQRERIARAEREANGSNSRIRQPIVLSAVAASMLMMGTVVWRQTTTSDSAAQRPAPAIAAVEKAPTPTAENDTTRQPIYISPEMVQAMSTGNPMWPAALLVDDAPAQLMNTEFTSVRSLRD
ncbi:MAG: zf-HC2 domain-containing protein [Gemmatimonas sp.]